MSLSTHEKNRPNSPLFTPVPLDQGGPFPPKYLPAPQTPVSQSPPRDTPDTFNQGGLHSPEHFMPIPDLTKPLCDTYKDLILPLGGQSIFSLGSGVPSKPPAQYKFDFTTGKTHAVSIPWKSARINELSFLKNVGLAVSDISTAFSASIEIGQVFIKHGISPLSGIQGHNVPLQFYSDFGVAGLKTIGSIWAGAQATAAAPAIALAVGATFGTTASTVALIAVPVVAAYAASLLCGFLATKWGNMWHSFGQARTHGKPHVGGILFDKCAIVSGIVPRINGAYWDSSRGVLVLHGPDNVKESSELKLNGVEFDHFMVALRAAMAGEHIGVSIDPPKEYRDGIYRGVYPPAGTAMYVSYLGNTAGTLFGAVMFEADRVMKCLSKATDNITGHPLGAKHVHGYKSLFELFNQFRTGGSGSWFRFWFVIDTVEIAHDSSAKSLRFGNVRIKVLNETEMAGGEKVQQDPASVAFAQHLTEYYDEYAKEFPVFARLKELAKLSALARYLVNEGVAIDSQTVFKQPVLPVATPETTPGIHVNAPSSSGGSQSLFGGVDMNAHPTIISKNDTLAQRIRESAQSAYPGDFATTWDFIGPDGPAIACSMRLGKIKKPYLAFASSDHAFQESWLNSVRSVQRYYDSSIPGGDFGPGWWLFLPYRLEVISPSRKRPEVRLRSEETGNDYPSVVIFHNFINPGTRIYRRSKESDDSNGIAYCRVTNQEIDKDNTVSYSVNQSDAIRCRNGVYSYADGKYIFRFNDKGQLKETKTADGALARYQWNDSLLDSINYGGGRTYKIHYNRNFLLPRISEIVASDGVVLRYSYDDNGLLMECMNGNLRKVSYRYDQHMRISETRNRDGVVVKRNAYDSNGNIAEGKKIITNISDGTNLTKEFIDGSISSVVDESGGKAEYTYRKDGSLASVRGLVSGKEQWMLEYEEGGKLIAAKDSDGVRYNISYHPDGQVKCVEGDNGSGVQLPGIDEKRKDICGSDADGCNWTVKRNDLGLPVTIIDSGRNKHHFRYNKKGLKSIKSPGWSFDVVRNNGVEEFRTKSKFGIKQTFIMDSHNAKAELAVECPEKGERRLTLDENSYKIKDCAGTVEYRFDKRTLTYGVIYEF